eukprot:13157446-Alexandrium_andersonii.AAC.1
MSASLVGSEMCIRDRCSLSLDGLPGKRSELSGVSGSLPDGRRSLPEDGACLLYTSDAADDM